MSDRTYRAVLEAALEHDIGDTNSRWLLAERVLAHIPENIADGKAGRNPEVSAARAANTSLLTELADQLADDGVTMPGSDKAQYSPAALSSLRTAARIWTPDRRYAHVAFRTHQEAMSLRGQAALASLVQAARSKRDIPVPESLDPEKWNAAVAAVRARTRGYKVTANDVRTALSRKTNLPQRSHRPTKKSKTETQSENEQSNNESVSDVLGPNSADSFEMTQALGDFARAGENIQSGVRHIGLVNPDQMTDERRDVLSASILHLSEMLSMAQAMVSGAPVDASEVIQ